MSTEANTRLYAGLDLHKRNVYCAIINQTGQPVYRRRWPNELALILGALAPYQAQLQAVAVESTFNWYWLVDGLQAARYPVRLANPSRMGEYGALKQTNDQTDALWIAELLRLGILPEGYIYPPAQRPIRDLLRRRMLIVRQSTQAILSLQSMLMRQCGREVSTAALRKWTQRELNETFGDVYSRAAARALLELAQEQRRQQRRLEQQAAGMLNSYGPFQRLQTVPGIGPILGAVIVLESGPMQRFADAGHYASYCRMVNSRCESNGKKKGENNRKNGNRYLSWAYLEAANLTVRYEARAQAWLSRKQARTNRVVALKALGCKLAKAAYYLLSDDAVKFQPARLFG